MSRTPNVSYQSYGSVPQDAETVSLSDSNEYSDVAGFIPDNTGVLTAVMSTDRSVTFPVISGQQYAGNFKKFMSTGSTTVTEVTVFY